MFKGLGLSTKLYLGFGTVLLVCAVLGGYAYLELIQIREHQMLITTDCLPGVYSIGKMKAQVMEAQILTGKLLHASGKEESERFEREIDEHKSAISKSIGDYEKTITRQADRDFFNAIKAARETFVAIRNTAVIPLIHEQKPKEAEAAMISQLEPAYNKFIAAIEASVTDNKNSADAAGARIESAVQSAKTGILSGLAIAMALGASIGIILSRSISTALRKVIDSLSEGSEQVSSASTQVSQSSQQMAEGASEQASSLEETSASLEEMSSMTKQNSDNARQADTMADETRQAVEKSRSAMTRMIEAIGEIKGSSDQTAKIIKTIDEIAFQTNLLALNAAVEAARAGDAGKGFAVVAEEVRNLAQRSAEAAKNTATLIEQSQKYADNGVSVSREVADILTHIVERVGKLSQLIGEVSSASMEQAKGIEQIGTAVTEMDKLTQSNAANAEESASASEELSAQANELRDMVGALVAIVGGSSNHAPAHPSRLPAKGNSPARSRPVPRPPSKSQPAASTATARVKSDWTAGAHEGRNGSPRNHQAYAMSKSARPEEVIPLDDDELKDF